MSADLGADIVVIGSGAGGATVAGELARQGLSVILVEAGPAFSDRPGWNVRNAFPRERELPRFGSFVDVSLGAQSNAASGPPGLPDAVASHAVGGMLVHWTNHCPEQHPRLERSGFLDDSEWDRLLARSRALLHVSPDVHADSIRQQRLVDRLGKAFPGGPSDRPVQAMPMAARRVAGQIVYSGADDLLRVDVPEEHARIRVLSRVIARRLRRSGDHITSVEAVSTVDGAPVHVEGSAFVVAGGAIGAPQLLAASDLDVRPALGAYLMDHPLVSSRVVLRPELREGAPECDPPFAVWLPLSQTRPWHVQVVRFHTGYSSVPCGVDARETADVFCFSTIDPRPQNRVTFDRERLDPFGLPQPSIELRLSADDRRRLAAGIADQFEVVSEIADTTSGWAPQLLPLGQSTHLMGSTRLGPVDDGTSVADTTGRVWGLPNVFVAGTPSSQRPTRATRR